MVGPQSMGRKPKRPCALSHVPLRQPVARSGRARMLLTGRFAIHENETSRLEAHLRAARRKWGVGQRMSRMPVPAPWSVRVWVEAR